MADIDADKEVPIVCETCLGDNPFVRMTKEPYGKACKVCERPMTVFRWKAGTDGRFKKTEICTTCAKMKHVCQTCILDLQYGVPTQVRDSILEEHERMKRPESDVMVQFTMEQFERDSEADKSLLYGGHGSGAGGPLRGGTSNAHTRLMEKMRAKKPYYERNKARICSFFVAGTCNRGEKCPYRHEIPQHDEALQKQNIKDRFYGTNDPVALKMLNKMKGPQKAPPAPADVTITTLWVGGVDGNMTEHDLRLPFMEYGEITSVRIVSLKKCAFVTFSTRAAAEEAMGKLFRNLEVRGVMLHLGWSKSDKKKGTCFVHVCTCYTVQY